MEAAISASPKKSWKTTFPLQYGRVITFRTGRYRTGLACLALVLGTLAIYWPAPGIQCDDDQRSDDHFGGRIDRR